MQSQLLQNWKIHFSLKLGFFRQIFKVLVLQGKNCEVFKQAVFAVTLPRTYALWNRRYPASIIPAVLSSPLLHLVEPSLRRTLAVYVATAAAVNFRRGSKQRQILPPTWTLILVANSWLLWAFLFQRKCFPRGYGDLIYGVSTQTHSTNSLKEYGSSIRAMAQASPLNSWSSSCSRPSLSVTPPEPYLLLSLLDPQKSTLLTRVPFALAYTLKHPAV